MIKAYSKLDSENNGETPDLKPELKLLESEN